MGVREFDACTRAILSGVQGIIGTILIRLNVQIALYRRQSSLAEWPILEVVGVSAITAAISYLVRQNIQSQMIR
jgi:chloride channel 3/4/5